MRPVVVFCGLVNRYWWLASLQQFDAGPVGQVQHDAGGERLGQFHLQGRAKLVEVPFVHDHDPGGLAVRRRGRVDAFQVLAGARAREQLRFFLQLEGP